MQGHIAVFRQCAFFMNMELIAQSLRYKKLLAALGDVAASPLPVLIRGELGSGRDTIAKEIHKRRGVGENSRFVRIKPACSDISFLSESAFEGRTDTFYLEEVSLLTKDVQQNLASFLRNTSFRSIPKVIVSTSKDLESSVKKSLFDSKLLSSLSRIIITVPPLREREKDIVPLAEKFLADCGNDLNKPLSGFSQAAIEKLQSYWWPGNLRELRLVMERAVLFSKGSRLEAGDIVLQCEKSAADMPLDFVTDKTLHGAINMFKKKYLSQILDESGWNKAEAARVLGIQRTYIFKLIDELGISRNS